MTAYTEIQSELMAAPKTWFLTGLTGFINSNLPANLTGYVLAVKDSAGITALMSWYMSQVGSK